MEDEEVKGIGSSDGIGRVCLHVALSVEGLEELSDRIGVISELCQRLKRQLEGIEDVDLTFRPEIRAETSR